MEEAGCGITVIITINTGRKIAEERIISQSNGRREEELQLAVSRVTIGIIITITTTTITVTSSTSITGVAVQACCPARRRPSRRPAQAVITRCGPRGSSPIRREPLWLIPPV